MKTRQHTTDTIFAIATPPGVGGVGVVRVSGPMCAEIAGAVLEVVPEPRYATLARFTGADGETIDSGIALFFPGPASFTGEDVLELQGHGGAVVQQLLCERLAGLGARPARPGEFSERAFLNDKLDLAQAEAIADLVASGTTAAARAAQRSLEGVFSGHVNDILAQLTSLRVYVEAALDFPDEEVDFIAESDVAERLAGAIAALDALRTEARQGRLLRDGITVAIVGPPNAGKSSLLNALAGTDAAIVTDVPGTTRDVLRETISIDGLPVHIADTAGIRETSDRVEAEGVRRARRALEAADLVLVVQDTTAPGTGNMIRDLPPESAVIRLWNKTDIAQPPSDAGEGGLAISALTGNGLDALKSAIRGAVGCDAVEGGTFSARTRHLDALRRTGAHLAAAQKHLDGGATPELLAEELRLAQNALGEITGVFLPDDLLGAIFASFCIGK
ncbi:MAG: tRNA uridine-5-carboxymethylaminomethyl(34) synthesis GTPase MnmE [Xanthomonadales bacterium]|nr:tRNA uridine-5-carboxymethylaminomethyl(34) synthesis GTPase MnmE [Xanthomonadales bacterium]